MQERADRDPRFLPPCPEGRARIFAVPGLEGFRLMRARYRRHRFRPHGHRFFAFCAVHQGLCGLEVSGDLRRVREGSFALLAPGEVHSGGPLSPELAYRAVYVERTRVEELLGLGAGGPETVAFVEPQPRDPELLADFAALHEALEVAPTETAARALEGVVRELLRRCAAPVPRPSGHRMAVRLALESIHACDEGSVSLDTLAARAGLSRFHLLRVFKQAVGLPPRSYQIQRRVGRAQELLARGLPIAEVAVRIGFYDQSHLGRYFKSIVGVSPGRYARSLRSG